MPSPEDLLERIVDRDSFIAFVRALADERASAAEIERANPEAYMLDGAYNWKNGGEPKPYHQPESEPSWRMFAEFLWCGKIIE